MSENFTPIYTTAHQNTTWTWKPLLEVDYTMGVLLLVCFSLGLLGNCLAFKYFSTQRRDLSNIIYILIVWVDIINSILMFSPGMAYFRSRRPLLLKYGWVCNWWGALFHVSSRMSVFLVATLSISRTISLCFPFMKVKRRHVLIPTAIYLVLLIIPALFPFYYRKEYMYDELAGLCLWGSFAQDVNPKSILYIIIYVCFIQLPLLLPFFPIFFSCLISVYQLRKKTPFSGDEVTQLKKRYASQTIVLVTIIYIILNVPVCVFILLEVIQVIMLRFGKDHNFILGDNMNIQLYLRLLLAVYCVGINAAVNPVVYLYRFKGFKKYSNNLSNRMRDRIKYKRVNKDCKAMSTIPSGLRKINAASAPFSFTGGHIYELQVTKWTCDQTGVENDLDHSYHSSEA